MKRTALSLASTIFLVGGLAFFAEGKLARVQTRTQVGGIIESNIGYKQEAHNLTGDILVN